MKKIFKKAIFLLSLLLLSAWYKLSYAGNNSSNNSSNNGYWNIGPSTRIQTTSDVAELLVKILNWLFSLFLIAAVGMFIYAGFMYTTAGGSDDKIKKAKKTLTYAIIGLVIAILSRSIVIVVKDILGANF